MRSSSVAISDKNRCDVERTMHSNSSPVIGVTEPPAFHILANYDNVMIVRNPNVPMKERMRIADLEGELLSKVTASRLNAARFVKVRVPCTCLNDLLKSLREAPRVLRCDMCGVDKPKKEMFCCSACLSNEYCSRECQKVAWPIHKQVCRMIAPKKEKK
jgi:hypothetical protein